MGSELCRQLARCEPEERGLDPYADPEELIKRLAGLCTESEAPLRAVPAPR
ncbi:hypothetical protein [Micromonospora sp. RTP1Z1]|uniref:hypothetical protein n=1 Tax=Micromonospora sp. RTP1Z1 TaxID=2994043 RepID=UPI0029C85FCD|nr:hypothetical protein [Micromonospora sp. RTP1Z1]